MIRSDEATKPEVGAPRDVALADLSADAFGDLVHPYRRELVVHCYRMLGSIDDAEDAVQDAFARAWRGRTTFQRAVSLRAWLYRIATNACLDAIERRKRGGSDESIGVGPFPDEILGEAEAGPEARYDSHESISLAFLTALQLLPPRQRVVLILRDVLSWRASEVATLLDLSESAVTSALHRARTTVSGQYRPSDADAAPKDSRARESGVLRSLLDRYVQAWEAADIAGLVALLRDDAVLSMPPGLSFDGAAAIGAFFASAVFTPGTEMRLKPIRANGSPGFVVYSRTVADEPFRAAIVVVLEVGDGRVSRIYAFVDPRAVTPFRVPATLA